jgi:hypothetical protein
MLPNKVGYIIVLGSFITFGGYLCYLSYKNVKDDPNFLDNIIARTNNKNLDNTNNDKKD